jgi:AraC family transcriptional regulator
MKTRLTYGNFIGTIKKQIHSCGFSYAEVLDISEGEVPLHTHEDPHFLFVLQGAYETSAKSIETSAAKKPDRLYSPGTLIFNPAGTTHRDHVHNRGGRFLTISISQKTIQYLQGSIDLIDHPVLFATGEPPWLAARLYKEFRVRDALSSLTMDGISFELLAHTAQREAGNENAAPGWLRSAREMLHDQCCDSIAIAEVARTVGVHPFHLTRSFRRFFRSTPAEYLRRCRIEKATSCLRKPNSSISEVALLCGFADQSQFTKMFRQAIGLTPGQYRKLFS